jgi:hypothetical protein
LYSNGKTFKTMSYKTSNKLFRIRGENSTSSFAIQHKWQETDHIKHITP